MEIVLGSCFLNYLDIWTMFKEERYRQGTCACLIKLHSLLLLQSLVNVLLLVGMGSVDRLMVFTARGVCYYNPVCVPYVQVRFA